MNSISIFRNRNYCKLLIGNTVSSLGDSMYNIALTVALYQRTGKVSSIAFMWLIRAVMRIPVQFIAGIAADSYPRKQLICFTNLISTPIALGFLFAGQENGIIIYGLIFFLQALNDMEQPAVMGLMQEIIEKDRLKEANATSALVSRIATLASPALAGGLMLVWGTSILFLINGISFFLAALILSSIRYTSVLEKKANRKFTLFRFAKEGYTKALGNKEILFLLYIGILPGIMGRFYEIYKVYVADKLLDFGAEGIVIFSYAMTIGGILSPLMIKYLLHSRELTVRFYVAIVTALSILMTLWGNVHHPIISFLLLTMGGTLFSSVGILLNTYLQEHVEKAFLGRVFSLYQMLMILGAIAGIVTAPVLLEIGNAGLGFAIVFGMTQGILLLWRLFGKKITEQNSHRSV